MITGVQSGHIATVAPAGVATLVPARADFFAVLLSIEISPTAVWTQTVISIERSSGVDLGNLTILVGTVLPYVRGDGSGIIYRHPALADLLQIRNAGGTNTFVVNFSFGWVSR